MEAVCIARKWGNSVGIVLPQEVVLKEKIHINDKLKIDIEKEYDLSHLFGKVKTGMSGQKFKDMVKEGWEY